MDPSYKYSVKCGGGQRITTADGYIFPLSIKQGLPYLRMRPFTQSEYDTLPHVIMTSDKVWDPSIFDNDVDPNDSSYQNSKANILLLTRITLMF